MTFDDVSPSDMRILRRVAPQDIERLLSGRMPSAGVELDDLTSFFRDLGEAFPEPRVEAFEAEHVAAMMQAAADAPQIQAVAPAAGQPQRSTPAGYLFGLRRKMAAASAAALTAFSGMAVAGVLPPPVQTVVADTAGWVGIDLPGRAVTDEAPETAEERSVGSSSSEDRPSESQDAGAGPRRRSSDASGAGESTGGVSRRGGRGAAPGTDPEAADRRQDAAEEAEEAADEAADRRQDAAEEAEEAEEEVADDDADRRQDAAEEPEADEAEGAEEAEEEATDEARDRDEDSADEFEDASEEAETVD